MRMRRRSDSLAGETKMRNPDFLGSSHGPRRSACAETRKTSADQRRFERPTALKYERSLRRSALAEIPGHWFEFESEQHKDVAACIVDGSRKESTACMLRT